MIELDEAFAAVGAVAVVTNGWSDEAIEATARELAIECCDADALMAAAKNIAHTWTPRHRPALATFIHEYRVEVRRRVMRNQSLALPSGTQVVPPAQGMKAAAESYAAECDRCGRQPNWGTFTSFAHSIGGVR